MNEGKKVKKALIKYIKSLKNEEALALADKIEIHKEGEVIYSAQILSGTGGDGPSCDPLVECN